MEDKSKFKPNKKLINQVVEKEIERQKREFYGLPKNKVHKMNHLDALKLLRLYHFDGYSHQKLADLFKISISSVFGIILGRYHYSAYKQFNQETKK